MIPAKEDENHVVCFAVELPGEDMGTPRAKRSALQTAADTRPGGGHTVNQRGTRAAS